MTHPTVETLAPVDKELPLTPELPTRIDGLVIRLLDEDTDDPTVEAYFKKLQENSQSLHEGGLYLDESYAGPDDIFAIISDPHSDRRMYTVDYNGDVIGGVDMIKTDHPNQVEIVGWGEKVYQGKGLGTAASEAIIAHYLEAGFDITSKVIPTNAASTRVLGKLSFSNGGLEDGRVEFTKPADPTPR